MARTIDTRRHRAALPVFTPSAVAPEALAARTVGRETEIKRLVRAIRTAATTDNRPHQLIVGPRGSGKSHLLIVAVHEALSEEQISERVAVAMLPEDAVEIAGYEDLLVSIIDRVGGADDDRREAARELRSRHDVAGLEQATTQQLGGRVLVLVVENLNRVFHDLGDVGQARLRNLTETSGNVLLLASTPLLFDAVSAHTRPWYGSFAVEHLRELDAEEGRDLLYRVAIASGDKRLAGSLSTTKGLARVRAVEHLAGGSPRMWTVLAGCMTVDLLDELVPLVEALFDELAPYYQQRLWELAGVERKLVYELCRVGFSTVKDLARATGISQRAAATSLGRLHDASWVSRTKRADTDRRTTWYSVREPLLRHHVEYRETRGERLPAIVGFLRNWYWATELAAHLATVAPDSVAEMYVLAALSDVERPGSSGAWASVTTVDELVAVGRGWIANPGFGGLASLVVGVIAEAVGVSARQGVGNAAQIARSRLSQMERARADRTMRSVEAALDAVAGHVEDPLAACRLGLLAASECQESLDDRDRVALSLLGEAVGPVSRLTARWFEDRRSAVDRLTDDDERLRLIFLSSEALAEPDRDPTASLGKAMRVLCRCIDRFGAHDLTTRSVAWRSVALSSLVPDRDAVLSFAGTVVGSMGDERLSNELSLVLAGVYAISRVSGTRDDDVSDRWTSAWAEATAGSEQLRLIHRFMSPDLRKEADYSLIMDELSREEATNLTVALESAVRLFDGLTKGS